MMETHMETHMADIDFSLPRALTSRRPLDVFVNKA